MRMARNLLSLSLVLAGGLAAQTTAGYLARGKVTLTTARGVLSGTIAIAAAAPNLCKVTIDLRPAVNRRRLTAVFDGATAVIQGPARLLRTAPLAVSPAIGCALLAPRVAMAGPVLTTVPGTAHLATLVWTRGARRLELHYAYSSPSAALPASVTETVDGVTRLAIRYGTVGEHVFQAADFSPPQPDAAAAGAGGGQ